MKKIDPNKSQPRQVKRPSPMAMGFFYGWMSFYLLLKLLGK